MRIKVLSVGEETSKKSTKGFYKVFNLSYLTDGKSRSKDIPNFDKATYETLKNSHEGDEFDITLVKNGDFTNWGGVEKAVASSSSSGSTSGETGSASKRASTYESSEERAARQVYIIRQSSIANAITTLGAQTVGAVDPGQVMSIAEIYTQYVLNGPPVDAGDSVS